MKARKETCSHNLSAEVTSLMDWTIFLTTAPREVEFATLLRICGLRWRIEIIFKTWPGHLSFDAIHRVSDTGLRGVTG